MPPPLLEVRNLRVTFETERGPMPAVDGLDLLVEPGQVLGLVGESGSGKSVAMLAAMGLVRRPGRVSADRLSFNGIDLRTLSPRARRRLVGRDVAMIFQEPMSSLNPCFTVGWQIAEALRAHTALGRAARRARVVELLRLVGIPAPETRLRAFPHQLSGGMCQRVMIAMAIACNPMLLIADEPTTALDVTVEKQILDLLARLQRDHGMAMILITHDVAVVAQTANRLQVMYAGQAVENRPAPTALRTPAHPYTAALLSALPDPAAARAKLPTIPGVVPGIADRPPGCVFEPRCARAQAPCATPVPMRAVSEGEARCLFPLA